MKKTYDEVRFRHGSVDDVAIDELHLERLDDNTWWLAIYRGNKRTAFHITSSAPIQVELRENELNSSLVEQEVSA